MAKIGLSAPWIIFYRKLEAMFKYDAGVKVIYDEDQNCVTLYVDDGDKADALMKLLPSEKVFGEVKLTIKIVPGNEQHALGALSANTFDVAFFDNPVLSYVRVVSGVLTNDLIYVVFRKEVVQYWTDDLGDINGVCSTLYQYIAKDIFENTGFENVFYCTDTEEPRICDMLGAPLGEWP